MPQDQSSITKTALITAGTKGIGLEIARAFAREGYDLALTSRTPKEDEMFTKDEFKDRKVTLIALELGNEKNITGAFETAVTALGGIDILINNAGAILRKPIVDVAWDEWDEAMNANLKGAYFLSAAFARHCLEKDRTGSIVNIASTHGMVVLPERSVYGIAKAGIIHMSKTMAIEWAEHGIRVNAIAPGTVPTESRKSIFGEPASREKMLSRIPSGKFITPEEVAAAALYLAGDQAGSVTGHTLVLDGGMLSQ